MTNPSEDFAESCAMYWYDPQTLAQHSPAKLAFMRDRVFGGLASPQAIHFTLATGLRGFVAPTIYSLSDYKDQPLGWTTVRGENFLGPQDGGFDRVQFGGADA